MGCSPSTPAQLRYVDDSTASRKAALPLEARKAGLRHVKELATLTETEMQHLAQVSCIRVYQPGETIEGIDDYARKLCIVIQGRATLRRVSWSIGERGFERMLPREDKQEKRHVVAGGYWGEDRLRTGSSSDLIESFKKEQVKEVAVAETHTRLLELTMQEYSYAMRTLGCDFKGQFDCDSSSRKRSKLSPKSISTLDL